MNSKKFIKNTLFFLLLISLNSCYSNLTSTNDIFVKKYGKKVKEINQDRVNIDGNSKYINSSPPDNQEISDYFSLQKKSQNYVPIYNIGENAKHHFPDQSTLDNFSTNNPDNGIPTDIFEVSYQNPIYPPYRAIGSEFDMIYIPETDAFGNSTQNNQKEYKVINSNDLQQAITQIKNEKNPDDLIYSKILITEKKLQIKEKKDSQLNESDKFSEIAMIDEYRLAKKTDANKIDKKNKNSLKKTNQNKIN
jgi:hypothetical protein